MILAVDLGKTACRVELRRGSTTGAATGRGAPGLADARGVELALAAIDAAFRQIPGSLRPTLVGVGAAGALTAPDAAARLALRLADATGAEVAVTSDVVSAHAGAFDGAPGTLLIAGTGSVAYDLSPAGVLRRSGGRGPWLGDEGSGQWIGRRGLVAALTAADGGQETGLLERARVLAPLDSLPRWVTAGGAPAARMAEFAPAVLELAASGDDVASRIADEAAHELAALVVAAREGTTGSRTALAGGLTRDGYLLDLLSTALRLCGIETVPPAGSALDGAALIAAGRDLPHEPQVHRS